MKWSLRLLYLYLFSFVGLIIIVIGSVQLVDLGLKTFVFKDADRYEIYVDKMSPYGEGESQEVLQARQDLQMKRQRESQLVNSLSMIVVGIPLYIYHWKMIQKEGDRIA